jgi:hypothetical protein
VPKEIQAKGECHAAMKILRVNAALGEGEATATIVRLHSHQFVDVTANEWAVVNRDVKFVRFNVAIAVMPAKRGAAQD